MRNDKSTPRAVTLKDVAARCEVSTTTVSLALRRDARIRPVVVDRIIAVAAEMGYDPARYDIARRLVMRQHGVEFPGHIIALFLPRHYHLFPYYNAICRGVLDVVDAAEQYGVLIQYLGDETRELPLPAAFGRGDVDGVILCEAHEDPLRRHCASLRSLPGFGQRPIVSLPTDIPECCSVATEDAEGLYEATRHLLTLGHRHFLNFVFPAQGTIAAIRYAGICRALQEYHVDPATALHCTDTQTAGVSLRIEACDVERYTQWERPQLPAEHSLPALQQHWFIDYMRAHPQITAILAPNDPTARWIWTLLSVGGWRVPEDISLVGHDDTDPIYDLSGQNLLSSIRMPLERMGKEAAQLLMGQATGKRDIIRVTLPVEFMPRHSVAPAAC